MKIKKFESLINLLEDPDRQVYEEISKTLINEGTQIIPELENAWENSMNEIIQEKLENIIQTIQFKSIKNEFKDWINTGGLNLFEGSYWIAKYQYPELSYTSLVKIINEIAQEVWLELNNKLTALEKIRIVNHFLFVKHGFTKNKNNHHSPQNAFINNVIDLKKGNSLSLSILYASIAQKLGLPVYCVNLPSNTILAYVDEYTLENRPVANNEDDILFYINPINFGDVLGRQEIDYFLKQLKIEPKTSYYLPCSNIEMINQLINNLITSYERLNQKNKVSELKILGSLIFKNNSSY